MALQTRRIYYQLRSQGGSAFQTLTFLPGFGGGGGETLLAKRYSSVSNAAGAGFVDLPVPPTGAFHWTVSAPADSGLSRAEFYLGAGADGWLDDFINLGGAGAETSLIDAITAAVAAQARFIDGGGATAIYPAGQILDGGGATAF